MRQFLRFFSALALLLLAAAPVMAQGVNATAGAQAGIKDRQRPLRVLTKPIAPFVMQGKDGKLSGFSIDLWRALAAGMGRSSEITMLPTLKALLDGVREGAGDLGIAAVTITAEREKELDFSHPYFRSGLQVLVRAEDGNVITQALGVLRGLFASRSFRLAMAAMGVLVLVVAHVIWLVERRRNPQFTRSYPLGLWDAVYWTLVTISTVGYGDKTPKTHLGRAIALVLIIFGYVAFAWFTATITSAVTISELQGAINGPQDLPGKSVAVVAHSTSEKYLRRIPGVRLVPLARVEDAYAMLEAGKVDAVVYDFPSLSHYAAGAGRGKVRLVGPVFSHEPYGIALPQGSPLREEINRALLKSLENGEYQRIYEKWFPSPTDGDL